MPPVLIVPALALVAVAWATWRLDRRLAGDVTRLSGSADRLASLREAVAALGDQVDEVRSAHERLTGGGDRRRDLT